MVSLMTLTTSSTPKSKFEFGYYFLGFLFILFSGFLFPVALNAQVIINEIMYDLEGSDSGREWIEILNTGANAVDMSDWKFFEAETNHGLVLHQGDAVIQSGEYAIIADNPTKFLIDWSNFSGTIFDSSFSLKNTGEFISLRDADLNDIDSVTYDTELGAGGNGNSLQFSGSAWAVGSPTPSAVNENGEVINENNNENQDTETENNVVEEVAQPSTNNDAFPIEQQIFANAGDDMVVIVGADSLFEGQALGLKKEPLKNARFVWNFGDGSTKEGQNVLHHYKYPNEYVVVLNVSSGEYSASDRIIVEALPANLIISAVGDDFVELSNKSKRELDISWWRIRVSPSTSLGVNQYFTIPKDTIILSDKKLRFSSSATGLDTSNTKDVALLYPNNMEVFVFNEIPQQIKDLQNTSNSQGVSPAQTNHSQPAPTISRTESKSDIQNESDEPIEELEEELNVYSEQSVAISFAENNTESKSGGFYKWLLALFGIVGISSGAVVFMRKNTEKEVAVAKEENSPAGETDDIKIIE